MYSRLFSLLLLNSLSNLATASQGLRASRRLAGTCPSKKPTVGDTCSDVPAEGCPYDYTVVGCTVEQLRCAASVIYFCNSDTNEWDADFVPVPRCYLEGAPYGSCDPDNFQHGLCPSTQPNAGTDCSKTGSVTCDYNYTVGGCNKNSAYCYAAQTAECIHHSSDDSWEWQVETFTAEPCPNGRFADGTCEGTTFIAANGNGSF